MAQVNGKREIEAICDTWDGGLEQYLIWKLKQFLEPEKSDEAEIDGQDDLFNTDTDGIMDLDDDTDGIFYF